MLSCCILLLKCPATMLYVKVLHLAAKLQPAQSRDAPKNLEKLRLGVPEAKHDHITPACSLSTANRSNFLRTLPPLAANKRSRSKKASHVQRCECKQLWVFSRAGVCFLASLSFMTPVLALHGIRSSLVAFRGPMVAFQGVACGPTHGFLCTSKKAQQRWRSSGQF